MLNSFERIIKYLVSNIIAINNFFTSLIPENEVYCLEIFFDENLPN